MSNGNNNGIKSSNRRFKSLKSAAKRHKRRRGQALPIAVKFRVADMLASGAHSQKEIAKVVGVSESSVTKIKKAMNTFRKLFSRKFKNSIFKNFKIFCEFQ